MKLTPEDQSRLRDKELANIIRKLNAGKTLTAREEAKLAAASAGGHMESENYVGTWDDLAAALGKAIGGTVTRKAIQNWRNDPRFRDVILERAKLLERADGRHCVAEWLRLMADLQLKRGAADAASEPENAGDAEGEGIIRPPPVGGTRVQWDLAIAALDHRKKSNALGVAEGSLIVAAALEVPLGAMLATFQMKGAAFPSRVASRLTGLRDAGEIEDRLREELDADFADLQFASYLAEDAVAAAVAAVPFDPESEALLKLVTFESQDRDALMRLIAAVATEALRRLGRRAISSDRTESPTVSEETPAPPAEPAPPDNATHTRSRDDLPPAGPSSAKKPAASPASNKPSRIRRKARPQPATAAPEVEAAAVPAKRKAKRR